jgi:heat shock protein HslJ
MKNKVFAATLAVGLAAGLTACGTQPQTPPMLASLDALPGTQWALAEPAAAALPLGQQPELQFVSSTQVAGNSGCNRFAGALRLSGGGLQMGPLAGTRRACADELMAIESRVLRALDATRSARLEPGQLVLLDGRGAELMRWVQRR